MTKVTIRKAIVDDVDALFSVSSLAHNSGYDSIIPSRSFARFKRRYAPTLKNRMAYKKVASIRIVHPSWAFYIAEKDGHIVGYHCSKQISEDTALLRGLFVEPGYQGQGVGKKLFIHMLTHFDGFRLELKVLKYNARAIALYEQYGFVKTKRLVGRFFGAPQIIMVRQKQG